MRRRPRTRSKVRRHEDGRGESIWDRFCRDPGQGARRRHRRRSRATSTTAIPRTSRSCASSGLDAFRFSIAWPRIVPDGRGPVNEAGLDFYDRLVDALLEAGIRAVREPLSTGTCRRRSRTPAAGPSARPPRRSPSYADVVGAAARRPREGLDHAQRAVRARRGSATASARTRPGRTSVRDALAAAHHAAARRTAGRSRRSGATSPDAEVGIVVDLVADPSRERRPRRRRRRLRPRTACATAGSSIRSCAARIPRTCSSDSSTTAPPVRDGDLATIAVPLDFLGVNNYSRRIVRAGAERRPRSTCARPPAAADRHGLGGLSRRPLRLARADAPRVRRRSRSTSPRTAPRSPTSAATTAASTTSSGIALPRRLSRRDRASDRADGVPLRGYFVWSLLDNFEWALGLLEAVRPRLRRLPDARAGAEGQLLLVSRPDRLGPCAATVGRRRLSE